LFEEGDPRCDFDHSETPETNVVNGGGCRTEIECEEGGGDDDDVSDFDFFQRVGVGC
jgi:hypothetical protein